MLYELILINEIEQRAKNHFFECVYSVMDYVTNYNFCHVILNQ